MYVEPDKIGNGSFFRDIVSRARRAMSRWNEISRLSSDEIEEISRDLHIAVPEFLLLAQEPPSSAILLNRRLAQFGLSENSLAGRGDVLRDLQRVCGLCAQKVRCAADLDAGRQAAYCPNSSTLNSLTKNLAKYSV
ncbi:MAG TPA: hypothetical protein VHB49_12330 [Bradyrhizobium sp.]|nr:hypothetical protein [Bradyrhizobium sp.]